MGLFFNKEVAKDSSNSYLDDQKALFDMKDNSEKKVVDESYDDYVYKPKDYSNVPKYKARDGKKIDIVVDQNDFGYEELNPNVKTVNIQKKDLHDDLMELVNNEYIDEKNKINNTVFRYKLLWLANSAKLKNCSGRSATGYQKCTFRRCRGFCKWKNRCGSPRVWSSCSF